MEERLERVCKAFIENKDIFKQVFNWESNFLSIAGSSLYTMKNMKPSVERLKEVDEILKNKESIFSGFRDNVKVVVISHMAQSEDPEAYLDGVKNVYHRLLGNKMFSSSYHILAAIDIYDYAKDIDKTIERVSKIYALEKQEHPWLTKGEDLPYVAALALADISIEEAFVETEECFEMLKSEFPIDPLQSLAMVLALYEGNSQSKCQRVLDLYIALKENGISYGKHDSLASLGALAMLDMDVEDIVEEVKKADVFLGVQKGFGSWGMGAKNRWMFAALLVIFAYDPDPERMHMAVLNSIIMTKIAEDNATATAINMSLMR